MRFPRAELLLPIACAGAAVLLLASQFMNIFEINAGNPPVPGQTFDRITAIDQHSIAVLLLAIFAFACVLIAVASGSRPAAYGVAAAGVAALLIFLLKDLPDAGKAGTISSFEAVPLPDATTEPVFGFWLELASCLVLAVCGGAMATLRADQLGALGRVFRGRAKSKDKKQPADRSSEKPESPQGPKAHEKRASANNKPEKPRKAAKTKPG